jgi:hypothetical protein
MDRNLQIVFGETGNDFIPGTIIGDNYTFHRKTGYLGI